MRGSTSTASLHDDLYRLGPHFINTDPDCLAMVIILTGHMEGVEVEGGTASKDQAHSPSLRPPSECSPRNVKFSFLSYKLRRASEWEKFFPPCFLVFSPFLFRSLYIHTYIHTGMVYGSGYGYCAIVKFPIYLPVSLVSIVFLSVANGRREQSEMLVIFLPTAAADSFLMSCSLV